LQIGKLYQGHRLGELLMGMLFSVAAKSQMRKVMLTVFLSNEDARRFYKRLGYVSDSISPSQGEDGEHTTADYDIMSKACKHQLQGEEKAF